MVGLLCLVFLAASMLSILCKNLFIAELIKLIGSVEVEESRAELVALIRKRSRIR